jgi:hypothetical protein
MKIMTYNKIVSVLIAASLGCFIWWQFSRPPQHGASMRSMCRNNLKQVGFALRQYEEHYGALPPAFIADKHGRPAHSWRVLILPFMDHEKLYAKYRFDEPWNGPNNRKLEDQMPNYGHGDILACPQVVKDSKLPSNHTNYMCIVGPNSVFTGVTPQKLASITDDHDSTIMVIESQSHSVHWMEPRDLTPDQAFEGLLKGECHKFALNSLMVAGTAQIIPDTTDKATFIGLTTRAGGEPKADFGNVWKFLSERAR